MRTALAVAILVLTLAACGDEGAPTATDGSGSSSSMPTAIPAAPGAVRTVGVATVMDTGSPQLCLGPIAESYPPQCSGLPMAGWSWADQKGTYDSANGIRWGAYNVGGTWDGTTFTYADSMTAALYDPFLPPPTAPPEPAVRHTDAELEEIAQDVGGLPGALSYSADGERVLVDVVYDDGSLQAWADETYGEGVVVVTSRLADDQD